MAGPDPSAAHVQENLSLGARQLNIALTDSQVDTLVRFVQLLQKWNKVYNLTAVRSIDDMLGRHILDSLSVLKWMPAVANTVNRKTNTHEPPISDVDHVNVAENTAITDQGAAAHRTVHATNAFNKVDAIEEFDVLDVGTGAGLPVIPLAIMRPDLNFLSVESNGKKTRFQQQAVTELGLNNVRINQARIDVVADTARVVVSRAFTAPDKFLTAIQKNCTATSQVIIMLGTKERMPESLPAGFSLSQLQQIDVPQLESVRHVAICSRV